MMLSSTVILQGSRAPTSRHVLLGTRFADRPEELDLCYVAAGRFDGRYEQGFPA